MRLGRTPDAAAEREEELHLLTFLLPLAHMVEDGRMVDTSKY